jgi:hypothetical protein
MYRWQLVSVNENLLCIGSRCVGNSMCSIVLISSCLICVGSDENHAYFSGSKHVGGGDEGREPASEWNREEEVARW